MWGLLIVLMPGFGLGVCLLSELWQAVCTRVPGGHRLRPRRDGFLSCRRGPLVLVRQVRAGRIAAASR